MWLNSNATSSLSHIIDTSKDSVTNICGQDPQAATSNALNALTMVINNHMTSSQQITNKRKRVVGQPYRERFTTMEALLKVNEKEKKKDKKRIENL